MSETKQLAIAPSFELDAADADQLNRAFDPIHEQAKDWIAKAQGIVIKSELQVRDMRLAREYRLAIRDVRLQAEKKHKELKEGVLRRGRAIDGVRNIILDMIAPAEAHLMEQEKFVERLEEKRRSELKTHRDALLVPFGVNTEFYKLGEMPDEQFDALYAGAKAAHEAKIAAAKKAEDDRLAKIKADTEERERVRLENERLRKEAEAARAEAQRKDDETKAALRAQEEKAAAERAKIEAAAAKERAAAAEQRQRERIEEAAKLAAEIARAAKEKNAAEAKAKAEKAKADAIAAEERKKRETAEAAIAAEKARVAAEEKARLKAAADAAKAPDKQKLLAFAAVLKSLEVPELATSPELYGDIEMRILGLYNWIMEEAKNL